MVGALVLTHQRNFGGLRGGVLIHCKGVKHREHRGRQGKTTVTFLRIFAAFIAAYSVLINLCG